jgi:tRNA (cmo5U34)-methyltransferase
MKDELFRDPTTRLNRFEFNKNVAEVFDDMLTRSVPFYWEIQNMICDFAHKFVKEKGLIYDLGCSTGTTIKLLVETLNKKDLTFIGIDKSVDMLNKAKQKLIPYKEKIDFIAEDLNNNIEIKECDLVIVNLCLQFLELESREQLIKTIYKALKPNGCLLLIEKTKTKDSDIGSVFQEFYYELKKRKEYSNEEISNKQEALKGVLMPKTITENKSLLMKCGFQKIDTFFQWLNFVGFVALKE